MPQNYTPEFKKKIIRLHEEEGRTYKSITAEYGVSKASISKMVWVIPWRMPIKPRIQRRIRLHERMLKLRKENEKLHKENLFLKKAVAFFVKEID